MVRNIIGWLLMAVGILVMIVLLTYGGPVFPHIIGPAVLCIIGVTVLKLRRPAIKKKHT